MSQWPADATWHDPTIVGQAPGVELDRMLEDIIAGRRVNVSWPWPALTARARALLPGSITVLSGVGGSSKSLMVSQACLWWLDQGVPFSVFHLEEDREFHLLRAMAQLSGQSLMTNDIWIRNNPEAVRDAREEFRTTLAMLGQRIWDAPESDVGLTDLIDWLRDRVKDSRVIVIDPVTAADSGREPWLADRRFVMDAKRILRDSGASLVVVTHPRNSDPKHGNRLDNHAGGQAYNRFTQCVLMLGASEVKEVPVVERTEFGTRKSVAKVNRVLRISKARNGPGAGATLAYRFEAESLRFHEQGEIVER